MTSRKGAETGLEASTPEKSANECEVWGLILELAKIGPPPPRLASLPVFTSKTRQNGPVARQ